MANLRASYRRHLTQHLTPSHTRIKALPVPRIDAPENGRDEKISNEIEIPFVK